MSCTGPAGLPRPKKEPGRRRGALRRSSSRHSHGEREKKRWVFLSVFLCFCLSFFRSFFFAPSPFLLLLLLLLLLFFASSSLLGDQPFAAGTSSAWLHGARGGGARKADTRAAFGKCFPLATALPTHPPKDPRRTNPSARPAPTNPVTVKGPTKATVFVSPFLGFFFFGKPPPCKPHPKSKESEMQKDQKCGKPVVLPVM